MAEEAGQKVKQMVGLFTEEDKIHPTTRQLLSFATFGSLLNRVRRSIKQCCTIILDEVHEGFMELELLLLNLREIINYSKCRWPGTTLKILLVSATPQVDKLKAYFGEVLPQEHIRDLKVRGN